MLRIVQALGGFHLTKSKTLSPCGVLWGPTQTTLPFPCPLSYCLSYACSFIYTRHAGLLSASQILQDHSHLSSHCLERCFPNSHGSLCPAYVLKASCETYERLISDTLGCDGVTKSSPCPQTRESPMLSAMPPFQRTLPILQGTSALSFPSPF